MYAIYTLNTLHHNLHSSVHYAMSCSSWLSIFSLDFFIVAEMNVVDGQRLQLPAGH